MENKSVFLQYLSHGHDSTGSQYSRYAAESSSSCRGLGLNSMASVSRSSLHTHTHTHNRRGKRYVFTPAESNGVKIKIKTLSKCLTPLVLNKSHVVSFGNGVLSYSGCDRRAL